MKERYKTTIAVFLILTRKKGEYTEILLQKRQNTGYMDGKYDLSCSGHLEKDETIASAIIREAKEELGIIIEEKDISLRAVVHQHKNNYMQFFFTTKSYINEPQIEENDKCSDLEWFNIDDLPNDIIEGMRKVIDNIKNNIFYDDYDFTHQNRILNKK